MNRKSVEKEGLMLIRRINIIILLVMVGVTFVLLVTFPESYFWPTKEASFLGLGKELQQDLISVLVILTIPVLGVFLLANALATKQGKPIETGETK